MQVTAAYLTPPQVARRLGVKASRVIAWVRAGKLRGIDLSDGKRPRFRIAESDLQAFLSARAVQPPVRRVWRRQVAVTEYF